MNNSKTAVFLLACLIGASLCQGGQEGLRTFGRRPLTDLLPNAAPTPKARAKTNQQRLIRNKQGGAGGQKDGDRRGGEKGRAGGRPGAGHHGPEGEYLKRIKAAQNKPNTEGVKLQNEIAGLDEELTLGELKLQTCEDFEYKSNDKAYDAIPEGARRNVKAVFSGAASRLNHREEKLCCENTNILERLNTLIQILEKKKEAAVEAFDQRAQDLVTEGADGDGKKLGGEFRKLLGRLQKETGIVIRDEKHSHGGHHGHTSKAGRGSGGPQGKGGRGPQRGGQQRGGQRGGPQRGGQQGGPQRGGTGPRRLLQTPSTDTQPTDEEKVEKLKKFYQDGLEECRNFLAKQFLHSDLQACSGKSYIFQPAPVLSYSHLRGYCNQYLTKCGPRGAVFGADKLNRPSLENFVAQLEKINADAGKDIIKTISGVLRTGTIAILRANLDGNPADFDHDLTTRICINVSFNFVQRIDVEARQARYDAILPPVATTQDQDAAN